MDLVKLKTTLTEQKILVHDRTKNFICLCPLCGDHPNPRKRGHLYVSKNVELPIVHCFFCNEAMHLSKFISFITGNKEKIHEILSKEELENHSPQKSVKSFKIRFEEYKLPVIDMNSFLIKRMYIKQRTNNNIDPDKINNLIFDFGEFFRLNNIDIIGKDKQISDFEFDMLQTKFIGFLGKHNSVLFCRNANPDDGFKFKKIELQSDNINLLEYYNVYGNKSSSNTIVLSEGIFNILNENLIDSLKIKDEVNIYASGNGFVYSSLLKSICFDENLFKVNVVILSDRDKDPKDYKKFYFDNKHIIENIRIFYNRSGKDFGVFPQDPFEVSKKDIDFFLLNKK